MDIHYKETHTGQYIDFSSFTPWNMKISWVRSLYNRAKRICSNDALFANQIHKIKSFMSWNGYPKYLKKSIINRFSSTPNRKPPREEKEKEEEKVIWVRLPYNGIKGEHLVKNLLKKLKRCFKESVKFAVFYNTTKISNFCSTKDKLPKSQFSNVIYKISYIFLPHNI